MKRAIFRVSPELLAERFSFRGKIRIVDASFDRKNDVVELHLQGDGLPDGVNVSEGAPSLWVRLDDLQTP